MSTSQCIVAWASAMWPKRQWERELTFQQSWLSTPDPPKWFQAANWRQGKSDWETSFVKKQSCCAGDDRTETHYVSSSLWRSYPSSLVTSLLFQHSPARLSFCLSDQLASWLAGGGDPSPDTYCSVLFLLLLLLFLLVLSSPSLLYGKSWPPL